MMTGAATVFTVRDIAASIAHYRDVLGFTVTFEYGKPTSYACLCRDQINLHLLAAHRTKRIPGNGGVTVFVNDVDLLRAELAARGAKVLKPPRTTITVCVILTSSILMAISSHSAWDLVRRGEISSGAGQARPRATRCGSS